MTTRRLTRTFAIAFGALVVVTVAAGLIVTRATSAEPVTLRVVAFGPGSTPFDGGVVNCTTDNGEPCVIESTTSPRYPDADAVHFVDFDQAVDLEATQFDLAGPRYTYVACGFGPDGGASLERQISFAASPVPENTPASEWPDLGRVTQPSTSITNEIVPNEPTSPLGLLGDNCTIDTWYVHLSYNGPDALASTQNPAVDYYGDWSITIEPDRGAVTNTIAATNPTVAYTFDPDIELVDDDLTLNEFVERWAVPAPEPQRELGLLRIWGTIGGALALIAVVGLVVAVPSLRAARRAEELAVAERQARDDYLNNSPTPLGIADVDGAIVQASAGLEALFGGSLVGRFVHDLAVTDKHHHKVVAWFADPDDRTRPVGNARRLDGTEFPADVSLTRIDLDGIEHAAFAVSDATDRDKASRLDATERQRDLAQLAAHVTQHELARGVIAVAGAAEMAFDTDAPDELRDEGRDILLDAAPKLERSLRSARALVELGTSDHIADPRPVDVDDLLTDLDIDVHGDEVGVVLGDVDLMRLVLDNIAKNARAHAGATRLIVEYDPIGRGFAIDDDGPALDVDAFAQSWQTGERGAGSGSGQGLRIIQRAVAAMRGTVTWSADEDGGLVLHFDLPRPEA